MWGLMLNSVWSQSLDEETGLGSVGGSGEPQMETCRSHLQQTVMTQGEAEEDLSLLDKGVLRTAVMTGL